MLGDKHGLPLALQKRNRSREGPHRVHVERRGRLVEHEHAGVHRIGRRQDDRLLLPAGKRLGAAPEQTLDIERRRRLRHTFDHFLASDSEILASEGDFRGHIEVDELAARVLEHRPDVRGKLAHRPRGNRLSRNTRLALKIAFVHKRDKRVDKARERRLAAPRLPGHDDALAAGYLQRDAAKRRAGSALVAKRAAVEFDGTGRSGRRGSVFPHQSTPVLRQTANARSASAAMRHATSTAHALKR